MDYAMQSREFVGLTAEQIRDILQRDCGPFLVATPGPLWRGIGTADTVESAIVRAKTRAARRPRDSSLALSKLVDDWFLDKFGHRFRTQNVFFASYSIAPTVVYGTPFMAFPIGNFTPLASAEISDLTSELDCPEFDHGRMYEKDRQEVIDALENAGYRTGISALNIAHQRRTEVMVHCREYYLVNPEHYVFGNKPKAQVFAYLLGR